MHELIDLWNRSGARTPSERTVVLTFDVVAFRSLVTLTESGKIAGLKYLTELDSPDLFTEFLCDPQAFGNFLGQHGKQPYSNVHAFHLQAVPDKVPYCIIHGYPAENGKENDTTRQTLLKLKDKLETEFAINVVGVAFDGDSCWSPMHTDFARLWRAALLNNPQAISPMGWG
jgi:hypothetical protein